MAEFRLLGLVEVWEDGRPVDVGQPRQRSVLAALLVDAGRPVTLDTLVDRVWGEMPPDGARHALHTYLGRIRRLLAQLGGDPPVRLVHRSGVYVLDVDPDRVDLHRFRRLLDAARDPRCPDRDRATMLREALGLWRGEPLAGLTGPWPARVRESCRGQRLDAAVLWGQAELRVGDPAAVVDSLSELTAEYPLVEPLTAVLMRALHAVGRTADAVDRYTALRKRLVEELGTDPGAELQAVYHGILSGEDGPAIRAVPAQLPGGVPGFAGREAELARLDAVLAATTDRDGVAVVAVSGTAGVGKTTLALHWAHRVADRFPDGQLYVNLRGFDPSGTVLDPAEALRGFLEALDVTPQRIPSGLDAQIGLYRSLLAGRRMLVLLDNARDAEQVRPLLPGTPGALVVVTSRDRLPGLVAAEGAELLPLDLLSTVEARELLARRLGPLRIAADPEAADEIITRCAGLPLALVVVAARAVAHPAFPLRALAAELCDARGRLDPFESGDPATDARAVFSWSYRALGVAAARLFRLLGLHTGPAVSTHAAASLAGEPAGRVRPLLAELTRAQLVGERVTGRYTLHDLLRAYAAELALSTDDSERREAVLRVLDHYLHTAVTADRMLDPNRDPLAVAAPRPGVSIPALADPDRALAWFAAEHQVLLASLGQAAAAGCDTHVWQLALSLVTYLDRRGHWHDQATAQEAALAAVERLDDRHALARVHRVLGFAHARLGNYARAGTHYAQGLRLSEEVGDRAGEAHVHINLAWVLALQGRPGEALTHAEHAEQLARDEHHAVHVQALSMVAGLLVELGEYQRALDRCGEVLARGAGDRDVAAFTFDAMGTAHRRLGAHEEAAGCYLRALALYRELGDRYYEADVLVHLGDNHDAAGDPHAARDAWEEALAILDQLGHPDAERLKERLHRR